MKKNSSLVVFQDDDEAILDTPVSAFTKFHLSTTSFVNDPLLTASASDQMLFDFPIPPTIGNNSNNNGNMMMNGINGGCGEVGSSSNSNIMKHSSSIASLKPSLSNTSLSSMGSSSSNITASGGGKHRRRSSGSSGSSNTNIKKPTWFQDDVVSDSHHFDISILSATNQGEFKPIPSHKILHAGDHIEVHLKVNVKKLQFLKCTFEGVSTGHNNKSHIISKETIISHDFHLYPTAVDQELIKSRSKSLNLSSPPSLSNMLPSSSSSTINLYSNRLSSTTPTHNNSNNSNNTTSTDTSLSSTPSPPLQHKTSLSPTIESTTTTTSTTTTNEQEKSLLKQTIDIKKSSSHDLLYLYNHHLDQIDDQCPFLQPLPEIQESNFNPPVIHSCSEHQVLSERSHMFIFRYTIPSYLPTSFTINKDTKNGVFYRLVFSGLGELHNKFKSDGPLIKGICTSIPIGVINNSFCNIRNDMITSDSKVKSHSSILNDITIKSRLLYNNFGIIGSNVSLYLTIDNQSDSILKGFRLRLLNKQQSWKSNSNNNESICTSGGGSNSIDISVNNENNSNNTSNNNSSSSSSSSSKSNSKSSNSKSTTTTTSTSNDKNKKSKNKKDKDDNSSSSKSNNIDVNNITTTTTTTTNDNLEIELEEQEDEEDLYCTHIGMVASSKFKSNEYFIQPKSKYNTTVCFSIPSNLLPSVHLSNISNSYTFKISLKKSKQYLEFPITILPSHSYNNK